MFKFTKDPLKQIILYNYLSNKLDDNMIILLLSYLGIYYKINFDIESKTFNINNLKRIVDKDIFYEDIIYIKYLSSFKLHKQLLNDLYNISKYNHIFHRYEKPPVAIYMLYLNFNRYRYKIYIRYLKKYLILSNKIKIDVCKKCGNFYCGTNTKISINAICKCNKIDMTLFISNN